MGRINIMFSTDNVFIRGLFMEGDPPNKYEFSELAYNTKVIYKLCLRVYKCYKKPKVRAHFYTHVPPRLSHLYPEGCILYDDYIDAPWSIFETSRDIKEEPEIYENIGNNCLFQESIDFINY